MIGACSALQTCILLSLLAETMRLPSGDHITVPTQSVWPRYVAICLPLATSHICTALSSLVEAMRLPSGDHAIALTSLHVRDSWKPYSHLSHSIPALHARSQKQ